MTKLLIIAALLISYETTSATTINVQGDDVEVCTQEGLQVNSGGESKVYWPEEVGTTVCVDQDGNVYSKRL